MQKDQFLHLAPLESSVHWDRPLRKGRDCFLREQRTKLNSFRWRPTRRVPHRRPQVDGACPMGLALRGPSDYSFVGLFGFLLITERVKTGAVVRRKAVRDAGSVNYASFWYSESGEDSRMGTENTSDPAIQNMPKNGRSPSLSSVCCFFG